MPIENMKSQFSILFYQRNNWRRQILTDDLVILASAAMVGIAIITSVAVATGHDGAVVSGGFGGIITILNLTVLRAVRHGHKRKRSKT